MQIAPFRTQGQSRKPQWGTLLPALAAGLAAAGLAFLLVRSHLPAAEAALPLVPVVVAAHSIPARTKLTSALLTVRFVPTGDVPDGAMKTPGEVVGEVSVQAIPAGSTVTQSAVTPASAALGMAFALPPTLRAVTVATDPADGVDLFVRPQDHVDILATDEPGSGPAEARTVLQNVLLLAVGTETSPDAPPSTAAAPSGGASHVTVAVTPAQAQMLVLAGAQGHLHLALRAIGDGSETPLPVLPAPAAAEPREDPPRRAVSQPAKIEPLPPLSLSLQPVPPAAAKPAAQVSITVIKGSVSQTVSVEP